MRRAGRDGACLVPDGAVNAFPIGFGERVLDATGCGVGETFAGFELCARIIAPDHAIAILAVADIGEALTLLEVARALIASEVAAKSLHQN